MEPPSSALSSPTLEDTTSRLHFVHTTSRLLARRLHLLLRRGDPEAGASRNSGTGRYALWRGSGPPV